MKEKYKSPSIQVEELQKADVLCVSSETNLNPDNGQQSLLNFASWWN